MATPTTFEEFFHAERARLFKAPVVITGSRYEAEDIAQDAFLRVWERAARTRRDLRQVERVVRQPRTQSSS